MWKRKNAQFFFTSQRLRANTSVFFEICGFLLYWDLVLYLSFRAGIYGTKTGLFSCKIKFVILACSPASIAAALRRRTNGVSGILGGKTLFFSHFFQKSGRGLGQSPIKLSYCSSAKVGAALLPICFSFIVFSVNRQIPLIF